MNIYQGVVIDHRHGGGTIRLTPPDAHAMIASVSKVDVTVDKSMKVTRITLTENGTTSTYNVSGMSINPKVKSNVFTYSAPKTWEIIDLR
jgi:outer membrane lipoprotein-sorting protein